MDCGIEGLCGIKFPARQVGAGRVSLARVEVTSEGCGPLSRGDGSTQSSPGHCSEGSCCHPLVSELVFLFPYFFDSFMILDGPFRSRVLCQEPP